MYFMEDISFRMNFDLASSSYHKSRPEYPPEMYADMVDMLHNDYKAQKLEVLEIGSGSGQATKKLSEQFVTVDCIEPGKNFVSILNSIFYTNPDVKIYHSDFENFCTTKKYDLIFSGCALHWIEKELAYEKIRKLLNDDGWLMAVWNMPKFEDEIYSILDRCIAPFDSGFNIPKGTSEQLEYFDYGLHDFSVNRGYTSCSKTLYYTKQYLKDEELTDLIWSYANTRAMRERNSGLSLCLLKQSIKRLGNESQTVINCFPFV